MQPTARMLMLGGLLLLAPGLQGQEPPRDFTWDPGASGFSWHTDSNWQGPSSQHPDDSYDQAIFNAAAGNPELTRDVSGNVGAGLGQLVFQTAGWSINNEAGGDYTLYFNSIQTFSYNAAYSYGSGTNTINVKIALLDASQNFYTASGNTLVIAQGFHGWYAPTISSVNPTSSDTGAVRLDAPSTTSGTFFLRQGTLLIRNNDALGSSSGTVNLGGDQWTADGAYARLLTDAANITVPKSLRVRSYSGHNVNATLGGNQTSGASTFSGTVALELDTNLQSLNTDGNAVSFNGAISGVGGIRKIGGGTVVLGTANSYQGATEVHAGTLRAGTTAALPNGTAVWLANVAGAVLDLNGYNQTIGELTGGGASGGNISLGAATLTVGSGTYGGVISGSGGLTKTGSGTLTLNRAQSYTGATNVTGGTLRYGVSNLLHDSSHVTVSGGTAVLDLQDYSDQVGNVTLAGGLITGTGAAQLTSTGTAGFQLQSGRVEAILGGATATLAKTTAGTVTLAQYGNFGGLTRLVDGTLVLEHGGALRYSTVDLRAGDSGILSIGNVDAVLGGLTGSRNLAIPGGRTLSVGNNNANTEYAGVLSGDMARMEKVGSGLLVLSADQAYTGGTTISGGTLRLGNGGTTGWVQGDIVNNSWLDFQRSDSVAFTGEISGMGGLSQSGDGVLELTGALTYAGNTLINSGTLLFNSNLPPSLGAVVQVGNPLISGTAVLGGNGRIGRDVIVSRFAEIAPGNSIGTLAIGGDVRFDTGGVLRIELKGGEMALSDLLQVDGVLNISKATVVFAELSPLTHPAYVFASYGTLEGRFAEVMGLPEGYWIDYAYNGNQIALVPEPAAFALALALLAVLLAARRRPAG